MMASFQNTIQLTADTSCVEPLCNELLGLIRSAPEPLSKHLLGLGDIFDQLFRLDSDLAAASANELAVRFEPTELLTGLMSALRAGNWEGPGVQRCLEVIRHNSSSVGCVATTNVGPVPGESQDSSGAVHTDAQEGIN